MHMLLPVVFASLLYWPILRRFYVPAGVILMCVALAASSFATTSAGLIGTLGVLYGIGGSMCFGVCFVFLEDWFVKKRSIAYAIVFVSSRLGSKESVPSSHPEPGFTNQYLLFHNPENHIN